MIKIEQFTFNPFQENTYVLYDNSGECIVIDPGCYEKSEKNELISFIESKQLKVKELLNTHCHIDHVLGNNFIKEYFKVLLKIHKREDPILRAVKVYAPNYGFINYEDSTPDAFIGEGEVIEFGNSRLEIVDVPGHAPGHIAFYNKEEKICIGGDVLFKGSIGRTDLPGGNYDQLIQSIRTKIFTLGDDMTVYPGHGPATTVREEKKHNPYCGNNIQ
jgi:hydroxyacylglutathione hydrolase